VLQTEVGYPFWATAQTGLALAGREVMEERTSASPQPPIKRAHDAKQMQVALLPTHDAR